MEDASGKKMFNNYRNLQERNGRDIILVSNRESGGSITAPPNTWMFISSLIIIYVLHFY